MQARTALVAAIVAGALAVGIVAADVAWSLEARIDTRTDTGWETVTARPDDGSGHERFFPGIACAATELRLVVVNDKPFGDTFDVRISYQDPVTQRDEIVLDETWSLDRFASRDHTFTIPATAFPSDDQTDDDRPVDRTVHVNARVGDLWLDTCVQKEASA